MTNTMIHLIPTVKGAAVMTAIALGGTFTGVLADAIGEGTPITLGGAMGVGAVVVGGAWYLSSRLTKIEDRLKNIEQTCKVKPCAPEGAAVFHTNGKQHQ